MKTNLLITLLMTALSFLPLDAHAAKPVFGPKQYDVKERYGIENRYTAALTAAPGRYVIRIQNGSVPAERPDLLELSLNGEKVLKEAGYAHPFIACFVTLVKGSSMEVMVRDVRPTGMRRPAPTPKFSILTVLSSNIPGIEGAYGASTWEDVLDYVKSMRKIRNADAAKLALASADLRGDLQTRADAALKLGDLREPTARDFLLRLLGDTSDRPEVRAEAAIALGKLGDQSFIPVLMREVVNPNEMIRSAAARALSRYPEELTKEPLAAMLSGLDTMRMGALARSLVAAGWKPVAVIAGLADSKDPHVANMAVEILGGLQEPRATDLVLSYYAQPGNRSLRSIVIALGQTKDPRAVDPLLELAHDAARRAGLELEIAQALAALKDQRGAPAIAEMIKKSTSDLLTMRLQNEYRNLTGKDYR